jgi:hypothetical protein
VAVATEKRIRDRRIASLEQEMLILVVVAVAVLVPPSLADPVL